MFRNLCPMVDFPFLSITEVGVGVQHLLQPEKAGATEEATGGAAATSTAGQHNSHRTIGKSHFVHTLCTHCLHWLLSMLP